MNIIRVIRRTISSHTALFRPRPFLTHCSIPSIVNFSHRFMSVSIDPSSPSYDRPTTEGSVWFREYEKHEEPQQKSQQIARIQKIVFLGTGSAIPSPGRRNTSALAFLHTNGSITLLDCGEATQHQIMRSQSIRLTKIDVILITHLHGDHCFGLFGLLLTVGAQGRTEPIVLIGPVGIRKMMEAVFSASGGFGAYPLTIHELTPDCSHSLGYFPHADLTISAYPLSHRIASFGYVVTEGTRPGVLDPAKAAKLGARGRELGQLKSGEDVTLANGTVIRSSDVVGESQPGRMIGLLQDTYDSSSAAHALQHVDVLIHECTYDHALHDKSIAHGHSTAHMAGEYAASVHAKMLVLTHFSARYEKDGGTDNKPAVAVVMARALKLDGASVGVELLESVPTAPTIADLVNEASIAYRSRSVDQHMPINGVHAAEDFLVLQSEKERFIVAGSDLVGKHEDNKQTNTSSTTQIYTETVVEEQRRLSEIGNLS